MNKGRKLIKTPNGRWGFNAIPEDPETGCSSDSDEFTCGEGVEIRGHNPLRRDSELWYRGRFEADMPGSSTQGTYYIILDIGFSFYPRAGTIARRPKNHLKVV